VVTVRGGILLDTTVVLAMRTPHRQAPALQAWLRSVDVSQCWVSVLTWMELRVGILKMARTDPVQARLLDTWYESIRGNLASRTVPFDDAAATVSAPLWLMRARGSVDLLIGATALTRGFPLATRNAADFADIPGLVVINPWESTV